MEGTGAGDGHIIEKPFIRWQQALQNVGLAYRQKISMQVVDFQIDFSECSLVS
jgi:hypothetical protein